MFVTVALAVRVTAERYPVDNSLADFTDGYFNGD